MKNRKPTRASIETKFAQNELIIAGIATASLALNHTNEFVLFS